MLSLTQNSVNLHPVNFDALSPLKLIFGQYFCYFDANGVADLLHLTLAIGRDWRWVPVSEKVNIYNCSKIRSVELQSCTVHRNAYN